MLQWLAVTLSLMGISACDESPARKQQSGAPVPQWITSLIAREGSDSGLVVEEVTYHGVRAFLVMPPDRGDDTGNERVLHSDDGGVICEFGGIAGQVTVGSCDLDDIKYVRTHSGASAAQGDLREHTRQPRSNFR